MCYRQNKEQGKETKKQRNKEIKKEKVGNLLICSAIY